MNTDSKAGKDLLNRKVFAEKIATGIQSTASYSETGFVVGITGKWGSGKSTLLGFVEDYLKETQNKQNFSSCFISFNPWMFTEEENIRKSFLKHFLYSISSKTMKKRKRWKFLSNIFNLFKKSGKAHLPGGTITQDLGTLLNKYIERDTSLHYKEDIDNHLVSSKKKFFVFIDDIDRLYPKQVFEILQVLKLTGNFKNTYYIIAFDREAVEISIESQFKDYGKKYLDKIIQADFIIPEVPDETLEQVFFESVSTLLKNLDLTLNSSELASVWLHRGLKHFFKTLRDIYRFINSIELTLPQIAKEINLIDFLIIEAIRLYDYEGYQSIYKSASQSFKTYERKDSILESNNLKNEHTQKLLRYLFEKLNSRNESSKRLSDPAYFDRYFTLQVRSNDITEEEFKMLIESAHREQVLRNTFQYGRLKNLLLRLNDTNILSQYSTWTFTLIRDIYEFLDYNALDLEPYLNDYVNCILNLLHVKEKERDQYFNEFIQLVLHGSSGKLSFIKIYFLHFMILDAERETFFAPNAPEFKSFYKRKYGELREYYLKYIKDWKGYFGSYPVNNPLSYFTTVFLYDFARFFPDDYEKDIDFLIQKDPSLLVLIKNVVSINAADNQAYEVNQEYIKLYLPGRLYKLFLAKLKDVDTSLLNADQKQWRECIVNNNSRAK